MGETEDKRGATYQKQCLFGQLLNVHKQHAFVAFREPRELSETRLVSPDII